MNKNLSSKKIYIKSYGCQMNVYDSDRMFNLFESKGFKKTEIINEADIIILNTCHIREKATEKVYSDIGRIENIKKNFKLVVAGCVAQAEAEEIKKRSPRVDYIVGPQSYHKLPEMINFDNRKKQDDFLKNDFLQDEKFKKLIFKSSNKVTEFITVQEGCDKFCSFCVVPYTRGSEYSRPVRELIEEINIYIKNGISEVILLGQNVNAYHGTNSKGQQTNLAYLINKISDLEGIKRIRYMTSHPRDMNEQLINCHANNKKLMPFLHLPIQSGSNEILKRMNRKHSSEDYLEIIEKLRDARSDIALSSDFIVGFPGETEKDFKDTLNLVNKVKFVIAYSFMYSPRIGTPAAKYEEISNEIKKNRLYELQTLLKLQQKIYNKSFLNKNIEVLFDRKGRHKDQYIGRSIYNQSVFVSCEKNLIGHMLNVKIKDTNDFSLEGLTYGK